MRKINYLFIAGLTGLASCANNEYIGEGENPENVQSQNGAILFSSRGSMTTRGIQEVGAAAAKTLGENFIVEGVKQSALDKDFKIGEVVFDNYLVAWGANTAGTSADNTNDWKYVDVSATTKCPNDVWSTLKNVTTEKVQTIKYWDYSQPAYNFIAYSTGARTMVTGSTEVTKGSTVNVTKIDNANSDTKAYEFKAASAADFAQCYYTDVTPVLKTNYGDPVVLKFKNLSAKVRVGFYEVIPGYAVENLKFYLVDAGNAPTDLATGASSTNATLIGNGNATFPESGTISVKYPSTASKTNGTDNWNKAEVTVTSTAAETDPKYKEFGTVNYVASTDRNTKLTASKYLGTTLPTASYAGVEGDAYYTYVIPTNGIGKALTLRVDYTLRSIDGSNEAIIVHGAKAVVPDTYTNWKSNYAYTYIFKISDNTNGWTSTDPNDEAGLYPITFDAVVEAINEASPEQATVTTVATPSVTSYQYGHVKGQDYAAGTTSENDEFIWIQIMNNSNMPATLIEGLTTTNTKLYEVVAGTTEADVISALNVQDPDNTDADKITGRNGTVLNIKDVATLNIATADSKIPFKDGVERTPGAGKAAYFAPASSKYYAFVYTFKAASGSPKYIYTYDETVSKKDSEPTGWGTNYTNYYTKKSDNSGYEAATATYDEEAYYYRKYTVNDGEYAVKVIKVQ